MRCRCDSKVKVDACMIRIFCLWHVVGWREGDRFAISLIPSRASNTLNHSDLQFTTSRVQPIGNFPNPILHPSTIRYEASARYVAVICRISRKDHPLVTRKHCPLFRYSSVWHGNESGRVWRSISILQDLESFHFPFSLQLSMTEELWKHT